jgi:hypothetical protein
MSSLLVSRPLIAKDWRAADDRVRERRRSSATKRRAGKLDRLIDAPVVAGVPRTDPQRARPTSTEAEQVAWK